MRLVTGLLAALALCVIVPALAADEKVEFRLARVEDGSFDLAGVQEGKHPDGTIAWRETVQIAHDGAVRDIVWYSEGPDQKVLDHHTYRVSAPPPPAHVVYGQTYDLTASASASGQIWDAKYGETYGVLYGIQSKGSWCKFKSASRDGTAVTRSSDFYVGGVLPDIPVARQGTVTYTLTPHFWDDTSFVVFAQGCGMLLARYHYKRVAPGVQFDPVTIKSLPKGATAAPAPTPVAAPAATAKTKKPLAVTVSLDSFNQCWTDDTIEGAVTVRAPAEVPVGKQVTVMVATVRESSAADTLRILSGGRADDAETTLGLKINLSGGDKRTTNLNLDETRQASAPLGRAPFALRLPQAAKGDLPYKGVVLALAWIGEEYFGSAQAPFDLLEFRKGTRFVSLTPNPDPPVAGTPVELRLVCEVDGVPRNKLRVPVDVEGRLLWYGAPPEQWLDGALPDGTATRVPPMVPLPAQRVDALVPPGAPGQARAEVTWRVELKGAGPYVASVEMAPPGFDVLQREVNLKVVGPPPTTPPAAAQGQTQVTQTAEGEQGVTQQPPADAPAGTTNLARGKPAAQCCPVEGRDAHFAVDGLKQGNVEFRAGSRCGVPGAPYWTVDLGQVADVEQVRLYNWITNESMASYAKWIEVWFATTPTNSHQVYIRGENDTWGLDGKPLLINLKHLPATERQARYVTLRNGGDPPEDINLLEVEVYGRFVGQPPAEVAPPPGAQPGGGDGARRETAGGEVVTLGPLKLQVRDGKVILTADADVPDEPARLPIGTQLVSIGGKAVQVATTQELVKLLQPHQDGWAVMRFQLPDGKEVIVTIED